MANRITRSIRFPAELWAAIDECAAENKRSANNWLEVLATMGTAANAPEPLLDEISRRLA